MAASAARSRRESDPMQRLHDKIKAQCLKRVRDDRRRSIEERRRRSSASSAASLLSSPASSSSPSPFPIEGASGPPWPSAGAAAGAVWSDEEGLMAASSSDSSGGSFGAEPPSSSFSSVSSSSSSSSCIEEEERRLRFRARSIVQEELAKHQAAVSSRRASLAAAATAGGGEGAGGAAAAGFGGEGLGRGSFGVGGVGGGGGEWASTVADDAQAGERGRSGGRSVGKSGGGGGDEVEDEGWGSRRDDEEMVLDWAEMDGDVVDELILNCSSTFALSMEELLMAELQEQDEALIEAHEADRLEEEIREAQELTAAIESLADEQQHFDDGRFDGAHGAASSSSSSSSSSLSATHQGQEGRGRDDAVLCPQCKSHWLLLSADGRSVLCACGLRLRLACDYDDGMALAKLRDALAETYEEHRATHHCSRDLSFAVTRPNSLAHFFAGGEGGGGGGGGGEMDEDFMGLSGAEFGDEGFGPEEFLCASCSHCQFYSVVM